LATDVIIVGAGPAGTAAGQYIARAGYKVLILYKNCSSEENKALGGALSKKNFTALKLPKKLINRELHKLVYHFPEEGLHFSSKSDFVLFDRDVLNQLLIQRAKENGVRLLNLTLVYDFTKFDNEIAVHSRSLPKEENRQDLARIVVFADGTNTLAYKKFQIGFDGRSDGTAIAAAYELKHSKKTLDSVNFFFSEEISPFGYGWIFPKRDTVNVGVLCLISKMKHAIRQCLNNFVSSVVPGSREITGYVSRLMPQYYVEQLHGDSILVVGDAAGTADPADGGGIFNAIVSGKVCGKVVVEALESGNLTANFLGRYEELWRKTENYRLFKRSYFLQRLALENNVNIGIFLKKMGIFKRYNFHCGF
jgi:digeranylgeranylglycerophospholipid reductase